MLHPIMVSPGSAHAHLAMVCLLRTKTRVKQQEKKRKGGREGKTDNSVLVVRNILE